MYCALFVYICFKICTFKEELVDLPTQAVTGRRPWIVSWQEMIEWSYRYRSRKRIITRWSERLLIHGWIDRQTDIGCCPMQRVYGAWLYIEADDKTFSHCGGLRVRKAEKNSSQKQITTNINWQSTFDIIVSIWNIKVLIRFLYHFKSF